MRCTVQTAFERACWVGEGIDDYRLQLLHLRIHFGVHLKTLFTQATSSQWVSMLGSRARTFLPTVELFQWAIFSWELPLSLGSSYLICPFFSLFICIRPAPQSNGSPWPLLLPFSLSFTGIFLNKSLGNLILSWHLFLRGRTDLQGQVQDQGEPMIIIHINGISGWSKEWSCGPHRTVRILSWRLVNLK